MFDRKQPFEPTVEMMVSYNDYDDEGNGIGEPTRWENPNGFTLEWCAKGWGFGTTSFGRRDGLDGLYCGDEYMGMLNAANVLKTYAESTPQNQWPSLLKDYKDWSLLIADVNDWESKKRD